MSLREPLRFEAIALDKPWGGHTLGDFCDGVPARPEPVGEVWQLSDREDNASVVAEGSFSGRSLRGLMLSEREDILGNSRPAAGGDFPLLVKLLQTSQPLSVQVHPDARAAECIGGGAEPKEECWYVLDAGERSEIWLGLRPEVDAASFAASAAGPEVLELLEAHPVRKDQFYAVPAGTVHAIGTGITLVEVQQNSDTTFRIFDWGRTDASGEPRDTHLEEAFQAIDYEQQVPGPTHPDFGADDGVNRISRLLEGDAFGVALLRVHEPMIHDTFGRAWVYVVTAGRGRLTVPGAGEDEWQVSRGQTWLLPAAAGEHRFDSIGGELEMLRVEAKA